MPEDFDAILIDHVMATLPENITERRRVLNALCIRAPKNHPKTKAVASILSHLDMHMISQREFAFKFTHRRAVTRQTT